MSTITIDLLNSIRDNASTAYQDTIPVATRDNLATIGKYLESYQPLLNEFTDALIGKIVLTIFNTKLFQNRLQDLNKVRSLTDPMLKRSSLK
jgi:hypothetical protein